MKWKIAAYARSEHAAATPWWTPAKIPQKTLAFHQQRVYNLPNQAKNILPQTFPSPYDYPISEPYTRFEGQRHRHPR